MPVVPATKSKQPYLPSQVGSNGFIGLKVVEKLLELGKIVL